MFIAEAAAPLLETSPAESLLDRHVRAAVLFVHGIGWQQPGETVTAFGSDLLNYLARVNRRDASPSATAIWALPCETGRRPLIARLRTLVTWLWSELRLRPAIARVPLTPMPHPRMRTAVSRTTLSRGP